MKDYKLIKYFAKLTKQKTWRSKKYLNCCFLYDEAAIGAYITFKNKTSISVEFDLSDVYEEYASDKYKTYENFVGAFLKAYPCYDRFELNGSPLVSSDLSKNRAEHVASQALINVTIIIMNLNKFLKRNAEYFKEEDWRNIHRRYLKKRKNISLVQSLISLAVLLGDILFGALAPLNGDEALILLGMALGFLITPILTIAFAIKYRYFKSQLKKSLRDTR